MVPRFPVRMGVLLEPVCRRDSGLVLYRRIPARVDVEDVRIDQVELSQIAFLVSVRVVLPSQGIENVRLGRVGCSCERRER